MAIHRCEEVGTAAVAAEGYRGPLMPQALDDNAAPSAPRRYAALGMACSPMNTGGAENPFFRAEFKRWRAKPLLYMGFALLLAVLLAVNYHQRLASFPFATGKRDILQMYVLPMLNQLYFLVMRPSAVIPALMVWRALYAFRDGPMYEPFRLTMVTPGQFLRGVCGIPLLVGLGIVLAYATLVVMPTVIQGSEPLGRAYSRQHGSYERVMLILVAPNMIAVIGEGFANGLLISVGTMLFGVRSRARLEGLIHAVLFCVAIQALQSITATPMGSLARLAMRLGPDPVWQNSISRSAGLLAYMAVKTVAAAFLWRYTVRRIQQGFDY
jgi:hypothetical protein